MQNYYSYFSSPLTDLRNACGRSNGYNLNLTAVHAGRGHCGTRRRRTSALARAIRAHRAAET